MNDSLDFDWMKTDFDDSGWMQATNGVGFQIITNGFYVRTIKANITVDSLDRAFAVITNLSYQSYSYDGYYPYVNFFNTGSEGHYANNLSFPGLTMGIDVDDYVVEVRGIVNIPTAGSYSFGVNSDDGFGMQIGPFQMSYPAPRAQVIQFQPFSSLNRDNINYILYFMKGAAAPDSKYLLLPGLIQHGTTTLS